MSASEILLMALAVIGVDRLIQTIADLLSEVAL